MGHFLMSGTRISKNTHSETEGDLMYPAKEGGGTNIGKATIQRILKGAGLGGHDSPSVSPPSSLTND